MTKGRSITQDPKTGRITAATLDSETAREMGERGHQQQKGTSRDKLLRAEGYENPEDAPEDLQIVAKIASGGGAAAVTAMRLFHSMTGTSDGAPAENGRCPYQDTCSIFRNEGE